MASWRCARSRPMASRPLPAARVAACKRHTGPWVRPERALKNNGERLVATRSWLMQLSFMWERTGRRAAGGGAGPGQRRVHRPRAAVVLSRSFNCAVHRAHPLPDVTFAGHSIIFESRPAASLTSLPIG